MRRTLCALALVLLAACGSPTAPALSQTAGDSIPPTTGSIKIILVWNCDDHLTALAHPETCRRHGPQPGGWR